MRFPWCADTGYTVHMKQACVEKSERPLCIDGVQEENKK